MPLDDARERFEQGVSAHRVGDLAKAEAIYRELSNVRVARKNLAALLRGTGRFEEAVEILRTLATDDDGRYNLAIALLAEGRYAEGWPLYEARFGVSVDRVERPPLSFPQWAGEEVSSLLVWSEQGFGDAIMFARYVPILVERGISVTLACRPELARLFRQLGANVLVTAGDFQIPRHDAWVMLCSLAGRFGGIPEAPYLRAPAPRRGGAGLAWKGRPSHPNDAARSFMQKPLDLPSLHPEDTGARDFWDTAKIVHGLDLVVTVDTAIAHLAGALGRPCWIMLPSVGVDWRWMRDRNDSPWYPSVRLYRGSQSEVVEAVRRDLAEGEKAR